jgi:hypothetical protein
MPVRAHRLRVWLTATLLLAAAGPALGGTEEFSTFDVAGQEEDDESLLDHFMTRPPRDWRDEWERAPQAIRTSQGCLTSGQWFIDTDLKVRSALGRRARFGLSLRQSESDAASYDYLDFSFQFPTRFGTPGTMFRPLHDKSRQDFALTWEAGSDTSRYQVQTAFTIEDMLNNLWAFRQTRVGEQSEPYLRHPYEPGLSIATRHDHWRAELKGRYLTPSRKQVIGSSGSPRVATLWGTAGQASLEFRALGFEWETRGNNQQTLSTDQPVDLSRDDSHNFRRLWWVETALRRRVTRRLRAEACWLYQDRTQHFGPPVGPGLFRGIDRLLAAETRIEITPALTGRIGALYDRITIAQRGVPRFTYGTRIESRAYLGLIARFGRVSLSGVEGIELDPEPYEVWGIHDKGFLHLQATF